MTASVLLYHSINDRADLVAGGAALPVARFEEHMKFLAKSGRALTRTEACMDDRAKGIVVTFDDGDADTFETALPILEKFQVPATVFVSSSLLDTVWVDNGLKRKMMSKSQLRSLAASPLIEIGSHAHLHQSMVERSRSDLLADLTLSRQILEDIVDRRIRFLAYPHGLHDKAVMDAAQQAGFDAGFGCTDVCGGKFGLPRIGISSKDSLSRLKVKLLPGYRPTLVMARRILTRSF